MYFLEIPEEKNSEKRIVICSVWACPCLEVKWLATKLFVGKWQGLSDDADNIVSKMGIVLQSIKCHFVTGIDYMARDSWL